eukprot:m.63452 g.63452  ORF g.63452 m.63452 type:complete len:213 (-) comp11581_c0_seq1:42-680(-)
MADKKPAPPSGCPMGYGKTPVYDEPPDTDDRPIAQKETATRNKEVPGEQTPASTIPATGRGNSDDGQVWVNPSPYQLHRALERKGKPISKEDSFDVAAIHEMVCNGSWDAIMAFEELHANMCPAPKLARFEGRDGDYSPKARFFNLLGVPLPFDRHDWTVDRCGKEVRYIIDYYEVGDGSTYNIDARPAGVSGIFDRCRLAFNKVLQGDRPW